MTATLDLDQLRTFVAIAETGSFTRAAEVVFKTQSAVSMQMRRLEERIGKPIFARDGRASRLTEDGERLLGYARRMVRLSEETIAAFDETELSGSVRPAPDDYASFARVLARFSRNPRVEVSVVCEQSDLMELARASEIDLASSPIAARARSGDPPEPLLWVASGQHCAETDEVLPLALSKAPCAWRATAIDALTASGRDSASSIRAPIERDRRRRHRRPASRCSPIGAPSGMRVLGEVDGLPRLPSCEIGIVRGQHRPPSAIVDKLAEHIVSS